MASQTDEELDYRTVINQLNDALHYANDEIYRSRQHITLSYYTLSLNEESFKENYEKTKFFKGIPKFAGFYLIFKKNLKQYN